MRIIMNEPWIRNDYCIDKPMSPGGLAELWMEWEEGGGPTTSTPLTRYTAFE
jgi:hypothetical protein